jgi:hypothetical protein
MLALAGNKVQLIFPLLVYEFIFFFLSFYANKKKNSKRDGEFIVDNF